MHREIQNDPYDFIEIDGLILIDTQSNYKRFKQLNPDATSWELERFLNHSHPGLGLPLHETIEEEIRAVEQLEGMLKRTYPNLHFTISHTIGYSEISFWQTTTDSPRDKCISVDLEQATGKAWCYNCGKPQNYRKSEHVDRRFEKVEWGICLECGEDLLIKSYERLIFI